MGDGQVVIDPVGGKRDLDAFIDLSYRLNRDDPNWVAPLRGDMVELLTPGRNPFHEHARVQYFLARQGARVVGRISAHIDELALAQPPEQGMGPGTGNWGLLEAESEPVAHALIARAEEWLRAEGMTRVLAPISLSVWEEPGQLVLGHDHPPTVLMGHQPKRYEGWIESAGYTTAKRLLTYELDITQEFPPLIRRIVQSGHRNDRITLRKVDRSRYEDEAKIIIGILNDAWSGNWGFVPFTETEIAYVGKKMKPLVREDLIMIAELDGEPIAFMMTLPDFNEPLAKTKGKLFPFGWFTLLKWLRKPIGSTVRVPLMGVVRKHRNSRLASQVAFMMIDTIRNASVANYGATRGEIGWILEDNQGMVAIADAIQCTVNREYRIYGKAL
ncbi:N-acetyltransferase [Alteriqipengyuania flavescens]|uniref:N-acetyltransferase n=1 Tax=Alteriqipengyuania flavescens TaxID=3053610 RepID=UPI0025B42BE5|nr:N-acetyltransferase [Alteriqipengyuania flavescens]WJY17520.1 N-acetyltransferase [Alteriqipengyuania flavescens]WJY23463.1 N-acetyltransferase [Alteriqipengyuania flavescens]